MLVSDLCRDKNCDLIAGSPLWNRTAEKLSQVDLQAFLRQHHGLQTYHEASRQAEKLASLIWNALLGGKLEGTPSVIYFETPKSRLTIGELRSWLEPFSLPRRRAVLFGLETKMPIQDIICLTWGKLRGLTQTSHFALELAQANVRHIRLDYVFWEPMANAAAAPLFGLGETAFEVSQGMGYDVLTRLYDDILLVDEESDCEQFSLVLMDEYRVRASSTH